jgi:pSer/pThr/pTyr-binding forkhead associated (FHA) protein
MAAKLILSMDGAVIKEYPLNKERMTIGRKSHNDIAIDNLAVSGEHAAIVTILHDSFLEDLDSTNGLEVNGTPTKKHFLQNNDVIEIGKYKLKYINDQVTQTSAADFEKTMVMRAPVKQVAPPPSQPTATEVAEQTGKFDAPHGAALPQGPATTSSKTTATSVDASQHLAVVQVLTGPNAGKELELVKNLTTLGKPGVQVAVLTRRPQGF